MNTGCGHERQPRMRPRYHGGTDQRLNTQAATCSSQLCFCADVTLVPTACKMHKSEVGVKVCFPGPAAGKVDNGGNTEHSETQNRKWVNSVPLLGNDEMQCVSTLRCNHAK